MAQLCTSVRELLSSYSVQVAVDIFILFVIPCAGLISHCLTSGFSGMDNAEYS